MSKKNMFHKNKGETIVEVLVAVVVSTMVLTATFLMLNRAISTNVNVRNRVVALNIAREGIEAVRNIRDTNWLKYSGDRRGKWLCQDTLGNDNCGADGPPQYLASRNYTVDYDTTNQRYYVYDAVGLTPLDLLDDPAPFAEYRLYYDDIEGRYTHDDDGGTNSATPFYRQMRLTVHTTDNTLPDGSGGFCNAAQCKERKLEIVAEVQWLEDGAIGRSALEHHLYDFYEREDY